MPQNLEVSSPPPPSLRSPHAGSPRLGSPQLSARCDPPSSRDEGARGMTPMATDSLVSETSIQQHILQLKQQQELQQQLLLQSYHQQKQQLNEQHEMQLRQHLKYLEEQTKKAEEERVEKQNEVLEALRKKEKHKQSAVASAEVKQRLQDFIKNRQNDTGAHSLPVGRACHLHHHRSLDKSSPPASLSSSSSHPYRLPGGIVPNLDDFPLRKTASEPNICLKVRLKQRVIERRSSPLVRRKDRPPGPIKRRQTYTTVESGSTPDSGQSSPPNGPLASRSSSGSTPIHEEGAGSPFGAAATGSQGSCSDLTLYSSPSMPNIPLGRHPHSTQTEGMKLPIVSEADIRSDTMPGQMPLTGHVLPSTLPYYPTLPDSEGYTRTPSSSQQHLIPMDTCSGTGTLLSAVMFPPGIVPSLTEAQAKLNKTLQRPLGRTQSAPLPLGHPMLQGAAPTYLTHGVAAGSHFDPKHAMEHHSLIQQRIRQTVLTRSGSKSHVENVEEETEAAVAQAIGHGKSPEEVEETLNEEEAEVIDLTEKRMEVSEIVRPLRGDNELSLHHRDFHLKAFGRGTAIGPRSGSHVARPLSRALSSPLVTLTPSRSPQESLNFNKHGTSTGIAYDSLMQKHQCNCGDDSNHPENGSRLQAIWSELQDTGLIHRCHLVRARKATLEEIQSCHSEAHSLLFGTNPWNLQPVDMNKIVELPIKHFTRLPCGGVGVDSDTTWNEFHTPSAVKTAVGCVLELAFKVAQGDLQNGFAIVRPPGHHAEYQQAMGFCFFNSVAIAARRLQHKFNFKRILILDWDVHHGNGTQSMFYSDAHILYISLHRYDDGSFFPGTGSPTEVGKGEGYGYNVNIAWSGGLNPPMGDAEYMAAFRTIVMPIAKDFNPDIVLVSAGFDAAEGHASPLGGYKISPNCFGHMTKMLMTLAKGKVVLVLEGGYNLCAIRDAAIVCIRTLTGEEPAPMSGSEMARLPCQNAVKTLQNVVVIQSELWPVIQRHAAGISMSVLEAQGKEEQEETLSAMASLRVDHQHHQNSQVDSDCNSRMNCSDEVEPMEDIEDK